MEYHGFVRSMQYLLDCGLLVKTFVSDRHTAIAKHMREKLANIKHYFDIWHLKRVRLMHNVLQYSIKMLKSY